MCEPSPSDVRARLLAWYDANRRDLPWRRTRNPYHILVAEYLLQRTRIASGIPYYKRFLERFPTLTDLASAPLDEVLAVWEGLGFYGRARNLQPSDDGTRGDTLHADLAGLPSMPGRTLVSCSSRRRGTRASHPTQSAFHPCGPGCLWSRDRRSPRPLGAPTPRAASRRTLGTPGRRAERSVREGGPRRGGPVADGRRC